MKFKKTITFFILNLILSSCFTLKLPNPSANVLIVNHLNYLRYDYQSRSIGYPLYSDSEHYTSSNLNNLNRTFDQLNSDFENRLDEQLTNRILNNYRLNNLNIEINNDLRNELNEINELNNNLINESNNELNNEQLDLNNNHINESNQNELILENQQHNLILTNSTDHQRIEEINQLQQNEPSIFVILESDLSFLDNNLENTKTPKNDNKVNDTSNEFLNFEQSSNIYNSDNLDEILDSSNFDLLDYTTNTDDLNLANTNLSTYTTDSDLFLPENIDDLANDFLGLNSINFMESNLNNENNQIVDNSFFINNNPLETLNELQTQSNEQTINQHDSNFIHELLSDEDLQIIGFPNLESNLPTLNDLVNNTIDDLNNLELENKEDRIETSSDSAISSMSRSDWFDSGSNSSSHFDDQFNLNKEQKQIASTSSENVDLYLNDGFDLNESEFNLYQNQVVFDESILNIEETSSSRFDLNNQEINSNGILQNVLHNHTYTNNLDNDDLSSNQITSTTTLDLTNSQNSNQKQSVQQTRSTTTATNRIKTDTLETVRNRRLLEQDRSRQNSVNFDMFSMTSETSSNEEDRLSRDEKKAKDLQIPISVCEIINMPIDEFNECLTKYELNEMQLTLIRDIRRRGKNKVAAQNCRKRKINQIVGLQEEVNDLQMQKDKLLFDYENLFAIKELAQNKYQQLYKYIEDRSVTNAALLANFELNFRLTKRNNSEEYGAVGGLNQTQQFDHENQPNQINQLNEITSTNEYLILKNLTKNIKQETHKVQSNYKKALAMN